MKDMDKLRRERGMLTFDETLEFLNVKAPTLNKWLQTKKVKAARFPDTRVRYFFIDSLEEILRENEGAEYKYKKG